MHTHEPRYYSPSAKIHGPCACIFNSSGIFSFGVLSDCTQYSVPCTVRKNPQPKYKTLELKYKHSDHVFCTLAKIPGLICTVSTQYFITRCMAFAWAMVGRWTCFDSSRTAFWISGCNHLVMYNNLPTPEQ